MGEIARLLVLLVPFAAAGIPAFVADYRVGARLNATAAGTALLAAVRLLVFERPEPGIYFIVDDLNTTFVLLDRCVGFTTALFSASYIGRELEIGRLGPTFLRFYHAMYQAMLGSTSLALLSNDVGLMCGWGWRSPPS